MNKPTNSQIREAALQYYKDTFPTMRTEHIGEICNAFEAGIEWYLQQTDNWDTTPRNNEVANGIGPIGII